MTKTRVPAFGGLGLLLTVLAGCGGSSAHGTWTLPNGDLAGTRAAAGSRIDAHNVDGLRVRWRFRLTGRPSYGGSFASTPVADGDTVYVQDLSSNIFALDVDSGVPRWEHRFRAPNDGPNGLAVDDARVYGATDTDAFALAADSGTVLWQRHLTSQSEQFVDIAPVVWEGLVFVSTVGFKPFGRGTI
jgi:outer membrane protein assembly factor BamB